MLRALAKCRLLKGKREAANLPEGRTLNLEKRSEQTVGLRENRGDTRKDTIISVDLASEQLEEWRSGYGTPKVETLGKGYFEEDDDSAPARFIGGFSLGSQ